MISDVAAIPNINGWLCISFAKETPFLYLGRVLEGFGVGIISYTSQSFDVVVFSVKLSCPVALGDEIHHRGTVSHGAWMFRRDSWGLH
ncbi:hypothetical protein Bca52824_031260 [Brassica carinata]|uniref:Uncharacterized protein n=1 Tax=Brassica carinata TaxID=52824 RepID=A0A8X7V550_BRACI|nr:hypothetical protein Bca52824_031260 [Brassica carinata]